MIRVQPKVKLVMVRGVYSMKDIGREIMKATGWKSPQWDKWTLIAFGEEQPGGISTALPASFPDVDREEVGFKRKRDA